MRVSWGFLLADGSVSVDKAINPHQEWLKESGRG